MEVATTTETPRLETGTQPENIAAARVQPTAVADSTIQPAAAEHEEANENNALIQFAKDAIQWCGEFITMLTECVGEFIHSFSYTRDQRVVSSFVRKWQCHPIPDASAGRDFEQVRTEWEREFKELCSSARKYVKEFVAERTVNEASKERADDALVEMRITSSAGDPLVLVALMNWMKEPSDDHGDVGIAGDFQKLFMGMDPFSGKGSKGLSEQEVNAESYKALQGDQRAALREMVFGLFPHFLTDATDTSPAALDELLLTIMADPTSEQMLLEAMIKDAEYSKLLPDQFLQPEKHPEGKRVT
jgi:hypothetical protein